MNNIKNDNYYIEKVKENIDVIIEYTSNKIHEGFISDKFRNSHLDITFKQIIGFKNKMVHDYGKTDYGVVYEIIT